MDFCLRRRCTGVLLTALFILCAQCSDDAVTPGGADGGGKSDGASSLIGCTGCKDYVVERMLLPSTTAESDAYGYEHLGKRYNSLGKLIPLIAVLPTSNAQDWPDEATYSGKSLLLLRVKSSSLQNDPKARGQLWTGKARTCCPDSTKLTACKSAAKVGCFAGGDSFNLAPGSPNNQLLSGKISGGALALGPGKVTFRLHVPTWSSLDIPLTRATISGKITPTGIATGVLRGLITQADLKTSLIPFFVERLNKTYKDPTSTATTKDFIKKTFDTNKDGSITGPEVVGNALIQMVLQGDLDVDNDGSKEVALGVGIKAVWAKIKK